MEWLEQKAIHVVASAPISCVPRLLKRYVDDILEIVKEGYVCVEVLRLSQSNGVMSSAVSLPIHTFTWQA